jgi:hypothetical protein
MRNVTYQRYLDDPTVREALEEEARCLRDQAITRYLVAPIRAMLRRTRAGALESLERGGVGGTHRVCG